jgi:hypothetical protein
MSVADLESESVRGYMVAGRNHRFAAVYVPEIHQIWTNPDCSHAEVTAALPEEFIHATETALHPSEVLPLLNFLSDKKTHPGHDDFRDLVEALFVASSVLANSAPLDPTAAANVASPFKRLGMRVLDTAVLMARYAEPRPQDDEVRRQALWSVMAVLLNVIPLAPRKGDAILDLVLQFRPDSAWRTSHELYEGLLRHLSACVHGTGKEALGFTLRRPNDPHELFVKTVEIASEFLDARPDKVTATTPVLVSLMSLGVYRNLRLVWVKRVRSGLRADIEAWNMTESNVRSATVAFAQHGVDIARPQHQRDKCPALSTYLNCLAFVRTIVGTNGSVSEACLLNEMLDVLPHMLEQLTASAGDCELCRIAFDDEWFRQCSKRLQTLSGLQKATLLTCCAGYEHWLRTGCLDAIATSLPNLRTKRWTAICVTDRERAPASLPPYASYAFPSAKPRPLARFLPAAGHIWIMPECPDNLFDEIFRHEAYHAFSSCSLPSQYCHLWHTITGRHMIEPYRFNDIMEASLLLGAMLSRRQPLEPSSLPLATDAPSRLALRVLNRAKALARPGTTGTTDPTRDVLLSLIMLLHEIVPHRAGIAEAIADHLDKVREPAAWNNPLELKNCLRRDLKAQIAEESDCPFFVVGPDIHQEFGNILLFAAQVLAPIPERQRMVTATLPSLVAFLTYGIVWQVPVLRIRAHSTLYRAELHLAVPTASCLGVRREVLATSRANARVVHEHGVNCLCLRQRKKTLDRVRRFVQAPRLSVLDPCLNVALASLDVDPLLQGKTNCPACTELLNVPAIRTAAEMVDAFLGMKTPPHRHDYELWMRTECMELIGRTAQLGNPVKLSRR